MAEKPEHHCPHCGHRPQVGALRPQGEGSALTLVCSLCPNEWPFKSGHLRVQACDSCRAYHLTVDLAKDPAAVPDVDELAALPLDIWAQQQGFEKVQPNLAGI